MWSHVYLSEYFLFFKKKKVEVCVSMYLSFAFLWNSCYMSSWIICWEMCIWIHVCSCILEGGYYFAFYWYFKRKSCHNFPPSCQCKCFFGHFCGICTLYVIRLCFSCLQILEGLLKLPENRECADCKTKYVFFFLITRSFIVEIRMEGKIEWEADYILSGS